MFNHRAINKTKRSNRGRPLNWQTQKKQKQENKVEILLLTDVSVLGTFSSFLAITDMGATHRWLGD